MLLKMRLEQNLDLGRTFQQNLKELTDEKEIARFFKNCGGEKLVQSYIKLVEWWDSLSHDWHHKILNAPFKFIEEKLWFTLSQLNLEELQEWYKNIIERSQESFHKKGNEILSPNIWKRVASKILPKPKRTKRVLKLHQIVEEEGFQVILDKKDYHFTPESLEEFKAQVLSSVEEQPIVTENLFPFLKERNLDPLAILSPGDRAKFAERQRDELEQQVKQLIQEKQEQQEEISQLKQQNQSQQTEIEDLKQQNQQILEQNQQILEQMQEFRQFMEAAKSKDLATVK
ncbi:hypothetical protein [Crocosphaera chwakensis]|uniref:Uncharacterized protein n=1 Tax=Crocosphaera chwakensis CCY0110 TaxID=391612 RepID=A3IZ11_9CHRO|nr:hypothetical protein [Crocosphaera chwakensis]EAZ88278.1 hypothetical protein CY0110_14530 [Crocosphaera chwakensis CCY0110]